MTRSINQLKAIATENGKLMKMGRVLNLAIKGRLDFSAEEIQLLSTTVADRQPWSIEWIQSKLTQGVTHTNGQSGFIFTR